jgi:hypothetical protein
MLICTSLCAHSPVRAHAHRPSPRCAMHTRGSGRVGACTKVKKGGIEKETEIRGRERGGHAHQTGTWLEHRGYKFWIPPVDMAQLRGSAGMYEDLKEYLNWYDTRRDLQLPKNAPVIGLVLQRSHLVTGDEGHYSGVVSKLESMGAKVTPLFTTHSWLCLSEHCRQMCMAPSLTVQA